MRNGIVVISTLVLFILDRYQQSVSYDIDNLNKLIILVCRRQLCSSLQTFNAKATIDLGSCSTNVA